MPVKKRKSARVAAVEEDSRPEIAGNVSCITGTLSRPRATKGRDCEMVWAVTAAENLFGSGGGDEIKTIYTDTKKTAVSLVTLLKTSTMEDMSIADGEDGNPYFPVEELPAADHSERTVYKSAQEAWEVWNGNNLTESEDEPESDEEEEEQDEDDDIGIAGRIKKRLRLAALPQSK